MKLNKLKGIAIIGLILTISFGFMVKLYEVSLKNNTLKNLKNVLEATHKSLHIFVNNTLNQVTNLANEIEVTRDYLILDEFVDDFDYKCWIIINSDMEPVASNCKRSQIYLNHIKKYEEASKINILEKAMFLPPASLNGEHLSFYISEMGDKKNYLIMIKKNDKDFKDISNIGINGNSFESYFLDSNGYFLSGGRFHRQLAALGLIDNIDNSVFSLQVKDPGGNLLKGYIPTITREQMDFTLMAQSIVDKKSGSSSNKYNDYRGVPVYGQWIWDEDLNIGIAVEVDAEEALKSLDNIIVAVIIIFLIIMALSILVDYFINRYIFHKAEIDRKEKIKFRSIFESSLDSIVLFSLPDLAIMEINSTAINFFNVNIEKISLYNLYNLMLPGEKNHYLKEKIDKAIETVNDQRYYSFSWQFMAKDKEDFTYNINFVKIDLGSETYLQISIGDISKAVKDSKRIEEAQEIAKLGNWVWDIKTGLVNLSNIATNILGLDQSSITFKKLYTFISKEDRKRVKTIIETAIYNIRSFDFICKIMNGDSESYIDTKGSIEIYEGEIVKIIGTIQDVTSIEQSQKELNNYKNHLEELVQERTLELSSAKEEVLQEKLISDNIIDSLPTLFFLVDQNGKVLRYNKNFAMMAGYENGGHDDRFIDEFLGFNFSIIKENILSFGFYQFESDIKTVWEVAVPFLFTINSLKIRNEDYFIGSGTDLSDIRAAMSEIKKLSLVVEQSPASILITDKDGNIEYTNPEFSVVTGYSAAEAIGENPRILKSGVMDDNIYKNLWDTISSGETWHGDLINKNKSGEFYWESVFISPIINSKKEIEGYLSIKENITERKKLQDELIIAKEKAESSAKAKSMFLANMSHEIRTPMNSIIGFIELVMESNHLLDQDSHYLNTALESARTLLRIINDILDISKLDAKKFKIVNKTINLHQEIKRVIKLLSQQAKDKKINLELELQEYIPEFIISDSIRLNQILVNLIGNAIKFTHKGHVKLIVDIHNKDYIKFEIEDTGIGMTQEQVETIFDVFAQGDISTAKRYGGTGLGTTISKELVELLGGEIWAESTFGHGSKFFFTIPKIISEGHEVEFSDNSYTEDENRRYFNILMAEDIAVNASLVKIRMAKAGHRLTVVTNGIDAIDAVENDDYDIVLMDVHMPYMDGLESTKEIKKLDKGKDLPVVALTASVMEDELERCKEAGMIDIVSKPVRFEKLFKTINKYCTGGSLVPFSEIDNDEEFIEESNNEYIDLNIAVKTWSDKNIYFEALDSFISKYKKSGKDLETYISEKDYMNAFNLAHTLKGVTGNLYLSNVFEIVSNISDSLKNKNYNGLEEKVEVYTQELLNVIEFYNNISKESTIINDQDLLKDIKTVLVMAKRGSFDDRVYGILPLISKKERELLEESISNQDLESFISLLESFLNENED